MQVGKLVDAINARPKNRKGFSRSLVGKQLHVVLALSGGSGAAAGGGENEFNRDMLERCVAEFFDDVRWESMAGREKGEMGGRGVCASPVLC